MPAGGSLAGLEPLFTAAEVAGYLKVDVTTARRLFLDRPDVVKIGRISARGGKHPYCTLRIPASAVKRFLKERKR
ncbi:MAG: helix-turn-helix domain-containing protein [Bryobacteraceae bacterium]